MARDGRDGRDGRNGKDGKDGAPGLDGKSVYDIAVDVGFVGTREDFVRSLHGRDGERGRDGVPGINGKDGLRGPEGPRGPIGPMPKHEWRGTELRFEIRPNEWGEFVDLKGDKGEKGASGTTTVVGGGSVLIPNSYMPVGF